jgi:hypothetical protein
MFVGNGISKWPRSHQNYKRRYLCTLEGSPFVTRAHLIISLKRCRGQPRSFMLQRISLAQRYPKKMESRRVGPLYSSLRWFAIGLEPILFDSCLERNIGFFFKHLNHVIFVESIWEWFFKFVKKPMLFPCFPKQFGVLDWVPSKIYNLILCPI